MAATTAAWAGKATVRGSSESMRMILLTFSLIGLQFCWGTEMTYGTPYLLSLGMPKSQLSWVWVAGPLSGLIMQPIIGNISDRSTSKYGRRRPFMVAGTIMVVACMLLLAWTSEVVGMFVQDKETRKSVTIALAVLDIYVLDFVINIVQSCCRSIIVDTLPTEKQQQGSAWASRMIGIGHLMCQGIGSVDLHNVLGDTLGDTQFKKLCVIASVAMILAVGVTCRSVQERVIVTEGKMTSSSILPDFSQIAKVTREMPPRMQAICWIQFWCWIGWFPFLFYSSTWVGEIYMRHDLPPGTKHSDDIVSEIGRVGSNTMIIYGMISFVGSLILPAIVKSPDDEDRPSFTPRPHKLLEPVLKDMDGWKPTLLTAWTAGALLFAASMVWAPFVKSVRFATVLVAFCGLPWAVSSWAPFAFMGIEINRLGTSIPMTNSRKPSVDESNGLAKGSYLAQDHTSEPSKGSGELAGLYLAILNFYTAGPQFIGSGISIIVFTLLEPGQSPELAKDTKSSEHNSKDGPSAIGVCLFIGAVSATMAAWKTRDLRRLQN
ncbi:MFS general substrate transporter [Polychaeton citri CBS 116435]|uniref:MFS general substrate transporter n=1 Tax=Polychaeton citri CBS 116435 TaxID=1314669 RepID=A0A9P4Q241_9PEZI|nr:MFS general substrate transporter [Polychaeton citri CBS 116435]